MYCPETGRRALLLASVGVEHHLAVMALSHSDVWDEAYDKCMKSSDTLKCVQLS